VLGFGDDEINRLPDYLYPALANEIQQPKITHTPSKKHDKHLLNALNKILQLS